MESFITENQEQRFLIADPVCGEISIQVSPDPVPSLEFSLQSGQAMLCNFDYWLLGDGALEFAEDTSFLPGLTAVINAGSNRVNNVRLAPSGPGCICAFKLSSTNGQLILPLSTVLAATSGLSCQPYFQLSQRRSPEQPPVTLSLISGNGWIFSAAHAGIFHRKLKPGERICCPAAKIAAMTSTVDLERRVGPKSVTQAGLADLTGPGEIWLKTGCVDRLSPLANSMASSSNLAVAS